MQAKWGFAFSGSQLDRAAGLRGNSDRIEALWRAGNAAVLPLWRGKVPARGDALLWVGHDHPVLADAADAPVFLGLGDGKAWFGADISDWRPEDDPLPEPGVFFDPSEQRHPALGQEWRFVELRGIMAALSARDAELAAIAKSVLGWHRSHRFCSACGAQSAAAEAGWQRKCASCGASHFPRTDPVVIMLVTLGNKTLIGRSPGWPEGMYSCLAGFVEPAETLEDAVRREVAEETGVRVGNVRYLASQPWPFPSSLMIGCHGEALDEAITLDPAELEDAIWMTREEMAQVFAGDHPRIRAPRGGAIAGALMANWLADRID
ncbi:MAG: NAD(+) diphosphatase [Rhodobacteraceae bacterium]|nr:NAD(+) diphosphatase [Paracoccaceae bacterium]